MSALYGIDYAWGGPPAAKALRAAHVAWVGRYFSYDPTKNLHAAEYRFLNQLGIHVDVAWETTATRARAGEGAGRADALEAEVQRARCGMPEAQPIYFAVDYEARPEEIEAYFRAIHNTIGLARTGAYGSYDVIKALFDAGLISHGWQTYAWSHGKWDPRARLRQYSNGHVLAGVSCDYDAVLEIAGPYVPADELRWEHEYDRRQHQRGPWPLLRRRVLWRVMHKRLGAIAAAAELTGWDIANRRERARKLHARAG